MTHGILEINMLGLYGKYIGKERVITLCVEV